MKLWILMLTLLGLIGSVQAQSYVPTPATIYLFSGGAWVPATSTTGGGVVGNVPGNPIAMYCWNGTAWVPADATCFGGGSAASVPFSGITSATNTTATMHVGTGATLDTTGTGIINASQLGGTPAATILSSIPTVSGVGGDIACAMAGDTTIAQKTITGGTSTSSTSTVTAVAIQSGYFPGEKISVQGASPAGYNITNAVVASVGSGSITYNSTNNPGAWSSGGTISKWCGNQTNDAIAATPYTFQNTYSVPANWMQANLVAEAQAQMLFYVPTANSAGISKFQLNYGAVAVYLNQAALVMGTSAASTLPFGAVVRWGITGINTSQASFNIMPGSWPTTSTSNFFSNSATISQPTPLLTASATTLGPTIIYAATGVASGLTYVSGGTISGSQTCTLATFNNGCTGTTANIVITSGTPGAITITARGAACTAAPTTATIAGTNCTGTVTLSGGVLGGAIGNATEIVSFSAKAN